MRIAAVAAKVKRFLTFPQKRFERLQDGRLVLQFQHLLVLQRRQVR